MSNRVTADVALTFDDVLMLPSYSETLPSEVDLTTCLTKSIRLNLPIVSAAMDTVTESAMAIALAKEGGIGVIHKNMSIEEQADQVRAVKKYEGGLVTNPEAIGKTATVGDVKALARKNGFSSYPVLDENDRVVGIVTNRDVKFLLDDDIPVARIMSKNLVSVTRTNSERSGCLLPLNADEVKTMMLANRVEKIIVLDGEGRLDGLITHQDFIKAEMAPNACRDSEGHLRVGAAVGCGGDTPARVCCLVRSGTDVIVVDSSHGHSRNVLETIRSIRASYPKLAIIGGNVATPEGALALVEAGADGVKVGIGPGSICTTRIVTGCGCPQFSAISSVAEALKNVNIPVIADGGVRYSGDLAKALAAGASCVMLGSLLAGTDEAPGTPELHQGRMFKVYRGMGSMGAMQKGSADRYFQKSSDNKFVPEGVEGVVPCRGPLEDTVFQLMGGLRASMGLTGCANMLEFRSKPMFVRVTTNGVQENHPHSVLSIKEPPNYTSRP